MAQYETIKIIELRDWLVLYTRLLKEDKLAAFMYCCRTKRENTIVICNVNSIPEGYTVDNVVDIINGKHISL